MPSFIFSLLLSNKRYNTAIISNRPKIILKIRKTLDTICISIEVTPEVIPVVVKAETDSKSESIKTFFFKII